MTSYPSAAIPQDAAHARATPGAATSPARAGALARVRAGSAAGKPRPAAIAAPEAARESAAPRYPVSEIPRASNSTNPATAAPTAAPSVLIAYSRATGVTIRDASSTAYRAIAGSVPPISVAGGSTIAATIPAVTRSPSAPGPQARTGARRTSRPWARRATAAALVRPAPASRSAYSRSGRRARSAQGPAAAAPAARPPRKSASVREVAVASVPA